MTLTAVLSACGGTRGAGHADGGTVGGRAVTTTAVVPQSTDAGRVVFRRFLGGARSEGPLFVANADGTREAQLTHPGAHGEDDDPNWSPDGTKIVFSRIVGGGVSQIFTVAGDGSGLTKLSRGTCPPDVDLDTNPACEENMSPRYSTDGRKIAFVRDTGSTTGDWLESSQLEIMNADGSGARAVTAFPAHSGEVVGPSWSPDGKHIVFSRATNPTVGAPPALALFVIDADGSNSRQITPFSTNGGDPDWSPAGDLILFRRGIEPEHLAGGDLFTVHPDGTDMHQVTHLGDDVTTTHASFGPGGRSIAFGQTLPGGDVLRAADIYFVDTDGNHIRRLTTSPEPDRSPDWTAT